MCGLCVLNSTNQACEEDSQASIETQTEVPLAPLTCVSVRGAGQTCVCGAGVRNSGEGAVYGIHTPCMQAPQDPLSLKSSLKSLFDNFLRHRGRHADTQADSQSSNQPCGDGWPDRPCGVIVQNATARESQRGCHFCTSRGPSQTLTTSAESAPPLRPARSTGGKEPLPSPLRLRAERGGSWRHGGVGRGAKRSPGEGVLSCAWGEGHGIIV